MCFCFSNLAGHLAQARPIDKATFIQYHNSVAVVRNIGQGYYAIHADGVVISEEVDQTIDDAFRMASAVPSDELNVSLAAAPCSAEAFTSLGWRR
jgi:hypothetical protein